MAANIPVYSTNYRTIDSNKTFPSAVSFNTGKRYKRETNLKFYEGTVEQYESFRSQFNIHHKMLGWDTYRAGIELYMSLEGKAALKVEEVIMNASGMSNVAKMWNALDSAFLPIDHRESKYRQFATRRWRTSERMTEYMDELIRLFRKARPGSPASFQDEEVKNQLLSGLPYKVMEIVAGYLDLTAAEIARKFDVITSQREALGLRALGQTEKSLLSVQEKQSDSDDPIIYGEFEEVFAFRDGNHQNRFKGETCTYCNKKCHIETVCFAKHDDDKMVKMAKTISAAMAEEIAATNTKAMESILDTLNKMNLKG